MLAWRAMIGVIAMPSAQPVTRRVSQVLPHAKIPLRSLHAGMAQAQLDLFQHRGQGYRLLYGLRQSVSDPLDFRFDLLPLLETRLV
jgi:hypothetical protein